MRNFISTVNSNLTKTKIKVAVKVENITVDANSSRDYKFSFSNFGSYTNIIIQIPFVISNGLGITVGRDLNKDFTVRLWNNTSSSKNVSIAYYVLYNSN